MNKKIIICGGGTAGHIYPAIAIIEQISEQYKNIDICYIGTEKGMEARLIPPLGIKFITIKSSGLLQKSGIIRKIKSYIIFIINIISGLTYSLNIIRRSRPDVILGMGGYVCAPVFLACLLLRKEFYIHEQNYIPGRLNLIFARFAQKIFLSFKETEEYFRKKTKRTVFTGNPVRKIIREFRSGDKNYRKYGLKPGVFTITAFGGSLGADRINKSFIGLSDIMKDNKNLQFILISGKRFYSEISESSNGMVAGEDKNLRIIPYEDRMQDIYNISDLIISRSGANTVAEIAVCRIPAILIPFPNAINNHQYYNAKFLADNKKAIILEDSETNEYILEKILKDMISDNFRLYNGLKNKKGENIFSESHKIITDILIGDLFD